MSENAVQRLQKLEKDIKSVISIYESSKNGDSKNEETDTENENTHSFSRDRWGLTDKCSSAFEKFKKFASFSPLIGTISFPTEKKNEPVKKPSSAPSSTSTASFGPSESEHLWQATSDSSKVKWGDFSKSRDLLMTTSQTLRAADEVLSKNNFQGDEMKSASDDGMRTDELQVGQGKAQQSIEKVGGPKCRKAEIGDNSKVKTKKPDEKQIKEFVPASCIFISAGKETLRSQKFLKSDAARETLPATKKTPRTVKERLRNYEIKKRKNSSDRSNGPGTAPQCEKEASPTRTEQKKTVKKVMFLVPETGNGQIVQEAEKGESLSAIELFKIIEKSNEKLEKMQISKELALDIAAQLKEKHEEIRRSKENMMEKLQKLEKDNERLNVEIKDAREKKRKMQLKMEGFCTYSKTKLLKQDLKSKEIFEENELLRTWLKELEKKYNEDYIEKLSEIDKTQQERLTEIRNELKTRETRAEEEIKKLNDEKTKLLEKVEELHIGLHERQARVENLEGKIGALEGEVERQRQNLKKKTDKLEQTHKELDAIRQNSKVLEEQVGTLRANVENVDLMQKNLMIGIEDREKQIKANRTEIEKLQLENASLKREVEKERDVVLIKDKIIEDQQETIKQLRERSEEAKTLLKKNQSLERLLNREREEKLELQEAVECLKLKKEELKKKVKALEAELLVAPEEVVRDLQKTQVVLHELENQVHVKQKEWEHHLRVLVKEKEQACSIAEFATKKLMQTTNRFQRQSEAHKKLHQILAENLAEKERHLRETLSKGSCTQVKPILLDIHSEVNRSSQQMFRVSGNDAAISTDSEWQPKKIFAVEEILTEESPYFF